MGRTIVRTPTSRLLLGHVRIDITPPEGIYHGLWGAAPPHRAEGVHAPLYADVLAVRSHEACSPPLVMTFVDHVNLEDAQCERCRAGIAGAAGVPVERTTLSFSHTHASGFMNADRSGFPGGDAIAPYLESLEQRLATAAAGSVAALREVTVTYAPGSCAMAANRDYRDDERDGFVCGFNPDSPADEALLVGRITDAADAVIATIVHYGCHPTTLAWQNRLISPDFVGAARDLVERHTGAPCIFIQGACGDRGPRYGFVGDTRVADRNGRWLGFSALAAIESMGPPGADYHYAGAVVSGATIGSWEHRALAPDRARAVTRVAGGAFEVALPVKPMPDSESLREEMEASLAAQQAARACGDAVAARDHGARAERVRRWLQRLASIPGRDRYPYPFSVHRMGDAVFVAAGGEPYASIQAELASRFPELAIIFCPLSGAHAVGYLLPADRYGVGLYQEETTLLAPGSLETLTEAIAERIAATL